MARGNSIIVSANPRGVFMEGFIGAGQTPKPGTIMQVDPSVALRQGRHTYKAFARGADGDRPLGPFYVLRQDTLQGRDSTVAYAAGERCFLYAPLPGEELNLLIADVAGTGDDHALGEILIVQNTTGKMIVTASTPECEPACLLEAITDPTGDTLAWCLWSGC